MQPWILSCLSIRALTKGIVNIPSPLGQLRVLLELNLGAPDLDYLPDTSDSASVTDIPVQSLECLVFACGNNDRICTGVLEFVTPKIFARISQALQEHFQ